MTTETSPAPEPWYVEQQRARKASMIVATLASLGGTADDAAHFTAADRRMAEKVAGTRKASDATWRVVAEMLAASGRRRALCPFCGLGDPEGVSGPRQTYGHQGPCSR